VSIGQLITLIGIASPLIGVVIWLARIERKLNLFMIEHEMLVGDFAARQGVKISDLPTRSRSSW
jgi:hypothetical protein